jgi:hypothetical protein
VWMRQGERAAGPGHACCREQLGGRGACAAAGAGPRVGGRRGCRGSVEPDSQAAAQNRAPPAHPRPHPPPDPPSLSTTSSQNSGRLLRAPSQPFFPNVPSAHGLRSREGPAAAVAHVAGGSCKAKQLQDTKWGGGGGGVEPQVGPPPQEPHVGHRWRPVCRDLGRGSGACLAARRPGAGAGGA